MLHMQAFEIVVVVVRWVERSEECQEKCNLMQCTKRRTAVPDAKSFQHSDELLSKANQEDICNSHLSGWQTHKAQEKRMKAV